jgi:hypothetical protein
MLILTFESSPVALICALEPLAAFVIVNSFTALSILSYLTKSLLFSSFIPVPLPKLIEK